MSPIYVRPEREQAEHDRLIRFLQEKYSGQYEALANPGEERVAPVKLAGVMHFPDLVLNDEKRLAALIEIETAASVNNLETMAKWVPFSRARVPFHLYVPVQGYEAALRLAEAHQVKAAEIWTYRPAVEGFDLVRMFADPALQELKPQKPNATERNAAARPGTPTKPSTGARKAPKPTAATATRKTVTSAKPVKKTANATQARKPTRGSASARKPAAGKKPKVNRKSAPVSSGRKGAKASKAAAPGRKRR